MDLAETIVYQQLAGSAAKAIWGRVAALFDGRMTPATVLATSDEARRHDGAVWLRGSSIRSVRRAVG